MILPHTQKRFALSFSEAEEVQTAHHGPLMFMKVRLSATHKKDNTFQAGFGSVSLAECMGNK